MTIKRLFNSVIVLVAAASVLVTSCGGDEEETQALTLTLSQTSSMSPTDKVSALIKSTWTEGDVLAANDYSQEYYIASGLRTDSSSATSDITGTVVCKEGDEITLFYPRSMVDTVDYSRGTGYKVDLCNQDGTLDGIAKTAWALYGKAKVNYVNMGDHTATGVMTSAFTPLLGIAKINFTVNGKKPSEISRVCLSDVVSTLEFNSTQEPSAAVFDDPMGTGFIDVKENESTEFYISLFPGVNEPVFYVTADGEPCEGKAKITISKGEITEIDVDLKPASADDYIEVGGIKWAPANLIYNGEWTFAAKESDVIEPGKENSNNLDVFNWGTIGNVARKYGRTIDKYLSTSENVFIEGVMYKDMKGLYRVMSSNKAYYGDLVYWATKGKYRLPSLADFYCIAPLASEAITTIDGIETEFTTVNGVKGCRFTDQVNGNSIFLPAAGYRDIYGTRLLFGQIGRYMTGNSTSTSNSTVLFFDKDKTVLTDTHVGEVAHMGFKGYASSIRPVLVQ